MVGTDLVQEKNITNRLTSQTSSERNSRRSKNRKQPGSRRTYCCAAHSAPVRYPAGPPGPVYRQRTRAGQKRPSAGGAPRRVWWAWSLDLTTLGPRLPGPRSFLRRLLEKKNKSSLCCQMRVLVRACRAVARGHTDSERTARCRGHYSRKIKKTNTCIEY